jgi:hypothetical protein
MPPTSTFSVRNGFLVPSPAGARAMVKGLRTAMKSDSRLKAEFKKNPRTVLAARGFTREMQNELLIEMGKPVRVSASEGCGCTGCCATSSFCCETL